MDGEMISSSPDVQDSGHQFSGGVAPLVFIVTVLISQLPNFLIENVGINDCK